MEKYVSIKNRLLVPSTNIIFKPENVLKMLSKLFGIVFQLSQSERDQETYQTGALLAVMRYQVACHIVVRLALMPRLQTELFLSVSCNKKTTLLILKNRP